MGKSYGRDPEDRRLELAYALGNGIDPIEHFRQLSRARYGRSGEGGDRDA